MATISLDQLRTFAAVAEREHVTAAAAALNTSQGSVSALVRRLERALGLPLLHRVGRNVRLTDAGRDVHRLASQALRDVALIEALPQRYAGLEVGEVTVASGRLIGAHRLSGWLAPFIAAHPEVRLHIAMAPRERLVELLRTAEADIVVSGDVIDATGVETLVLERTEVVMAVAATHPLARSGEPRGDLGRHRHLQHEPGSSTAQRAASLLAGVDIAENLELEEGALLAALLAGLGYAAMPRAVIEDDIGNGRLAVLAHPGRRVHQAFTAARRAAPHTPAVQAFWEHLEHVAQLVAR